MSADDANTAAVDQHVDDDEKQYDDEDQDDENGSDSDYVGGNDANGAVEYTPDPIDLSIRHPLQNKWTMWYDTPIAQGKRSTAAAWHSNLKKIMDFDTVEDFWSLFNNLATPDSLPNGSNFHLFKEGIRPAWEDPQNAVGGKWVIAVKSSDTQTLNDAWINTILAMIGDAFEESSEICGAVASVRKGQNRLALWTRTGSNEILQSKIGRQWKAILNTPIVIQYQLHDEALKKKSSAKVAAYYTV